ncbi:DUF2189 domain-containing protein [uncultured Sulfitobacter sp.]|uniref:DUF2189 domain-containing protein n=1 Tax=uncultured Sulfitobacter sp. TaxID=191468 RepID=UPI002617897F|nr:DUF2189 domain-containing protein [uncultured Sulfitobacter sp.]
MADLMMERAHGAPAFAAPTIQTFRHALRAGWSDFRAAPAFGVIVAALCLLAGWGMTALTVWAGHTFWLVLGVFGFPLFAPFAALGTYEVSRLRSSGTYVTTRDVWRVLWQERNRQLPWLCALMMVILLFWFFLGHMIFALMLGLKPMTNIMSSTQVFLSVDGLIMLGLGSLVGGVFALLLFSVCVVGLPMLLDREVDYVTAMIRSISVVAQYPMMMLGWAVLIAFLLILAMVPAFFGLLVVLPWLGHSSWHVYAALRDGGALQTG